MKNKNNRIFESCAILGATGLVGRELLMIMNNDESFTFKNLLLYSSSSTTVTTLEYKSEKISVRPLDEKNIPQVDIVFSSLNESLSKQYVPHFLAKGSCVIDDSSAFRLEKDSALVLCGINDNLIKKKQRLYSQPNCVVVGIAYPLNLIIKKYPVTNVYVSTYQSISGAGKNALNDFYNNLVNYINGKALKLDVFKNDPILNAIPTIPDFSYESKQFPGFTKEEEKIILETKRILGTDFDIVPTCVRVSVEKGHSASISIEIDEKHIINAGYPEHKQVKEILSGDKFLIFSDSEVFTPKQASGKDEIYICRLKILGNTISFWATWDNLRIGAALNMWNIFKKLLAINRE